MYNTCRTTGMPNHLTVALCTTKIWPFEFREISTFHGSLNCRDSFPQRKFENRALTCYRPGAMLSLPTIRFQLHAKMADKIDLEKCSFQQFSEVQKPRDLDLGLGQRHNTMHNTCRTTNLPDHVSVVSCSTEIWPFAFREILTFREVWILVIAFLEGNAKIGLREVRSHTITDNHQFWALHENGRGDRPRIVQFSQLHKLHDLDLGSGRGHAGAHIWSYLTKLD